MEDRDLKLESWTDERLATLTPGAGWKPDEAGALRELRRRGMSSARRGWTALRRGLVFGIAGVAMAALLLVVMPTRGVCALGFCAAPEGPAEAEPVAPAALAPPVAPAVVAPEVVAPEVVAPEVVAPATLAPAVAKAPKPAPQPNVSSKPRPAPRAVEPFIPAMVCEIYSDFECPACAAFYLNTYPQLASEYGDIGKIRFVHRDFPLPQHPYARQAARYANAAGTLDLYAIVAKQLFATQAAWGSNGNIDREVAAVLPPGAMQKVRQLVANGAPLDADVENDIALGHADGLRQTPTMVIVRNGKREVIAPIPPFALLKQYLDEKMRE